jgi:2',3'-cyclic-nucleotide 2'-phosphodiesterase (5'-nucleotidase family)
MAMMGYDAMNIADGELSLGADVFTKLSSAAKVPMLSANLTGLPGVVPALIKQVGGLTVAITGVTAGSLLSPDADKAWGKGAGSPVEALKELLPKLRKQADVVILLSHLGYEGTVNLLQFNDIKGVDVAVAAHGRKLITDHETVGGTVIVQDSMGGEYLGLLRLQRSDDGLIKVMHSEVIGLGDTIPEDAKTLEMMAAFHTEENNIENALRNKREKEQLNGLDTKYLKMSPQQFIEELNKKKSSTGSGAPGAPVPVQ